MSENADIITNAQKHTWIKLWINRGYDMILSGLEVCSTCHSVRDETEMGYMLLYGKEECS